MGVTRPALLCDTVAQRAQRQVVKIVIHPLQDQDIRLRLRQHLCDCRNLRVRAAPQIPQEQSRPGAFQIHIPACQSQRIRTRG
jgi:hypothetical protein